MLLPIATLYAAVWFITSLALSVDDEEGLSLSIVDSIIFGLVWPFTITLFLLYLVLLPPDSE